MADYIGELRKLIGTRPILMCGAGVNDIPEKINPSMRVIIDDCILDYQKIIAS